MNKNTFTSVKLSKGEVSVYDFGGITLHDYKTNDFIDDEVFVLVKDGKRSMQHSRRTAAEIIWI